MNQVGLLLAIRKLCCKFDVYHCKEDLLEITRLMAFLAWETGSDTCWCQSGRIKIISCWILLLEYVLNLACYYRVN